MFEEKWAYEWREQRKVEQQQHHTPTMYSGDTEEVFSFGEEDTNDYSTGTDCNDCDDPDELHWIK